MERVSTDNSFPSAWLESFYFYILDHHEVFEFLADTHPHAIAKDGARYLFRVVN